MTALARTRSNCNRQTRPLVREGALHRRTCNCLTVIKICFWAPDGCFTARQTGRLTVSRKITLSLIQSSDHLYQKDKWALPRNLLTTGCYFSSSLHNKLSLTSPMNFYFRLLFFYIFTVSFLSVFLLPSEHAYETNTIRKTCTGTNVRIASLLARSHFASGRSCNRQN
jgi:hypothetical protein